MSELDWSKFAALPGAASDNFERLCRSIIQRHYGRYGDFRSQANQPGVEFHLKLREPCTLGDPERWYGWQCKWYDLPPGRAIGTGRRCRIRDAVAKTEEVLPRVTDWVLWTRHHLTAGDQEWFYDLPTRMRLCLWSGIEVEDYLTGPAVTLRSTYFGELILTPDLLEHMHHVSAIRIRNRWRPETHQEVAAERTLRRHLGAMEAWSNLPTLTERLASGASALAPSVVDLPTALRGKVAELVQTAHMLIDSLTQTQQALIKGDYKCLGPELAIGACATRNWDELLRRLRGGRHMVSLDATNLLADIRGSDKALSSLGQALRQRLIAVVGDAGCGKTELAGQLTAPHDDRPAGILLYGRDLQAGHTLDNLARRITIQGSLVQTFVALVAAVDAAGQRAGRRLPIVIDGLNEAEDPRDWKGLLGSLHVVLEEYPYVLVVCTLRPAFLQETLPDGVDALEIPNFGDDTVAAIRRYFRHYRINPTDAHVPWRLLEHPLTLRMFCEVTNPDREQTVGVEAMPGSLTALFDRYLDQIAERIQELAPRLERYYESDIRTALDRIGLALWEERTRSLDKDNIRKLVADDHRSWDKSIVRALEHEGVLIREPGDQPSTGNIAVVYDALAGHLIADALLNRFGGNDFEPWLENVCTTELTGDISERHPLATDIFSSLTGLSPRRRHRSQLWPLLDGSAKTRALYEAAWLEAAYLDSGTVSALANLTVAAPRGYRDVLDRIWTTRAAASHPLNAEFLNSALRMMSIPDRDLRWTEWIRRHHTPIAKDLQRIEDRWQIGALVRTEDRLCAQWVMWLLTSTVRRLRDQATRALYRFGCMDPSALFELTLDSLDVNDPYVPERMIAACYGVAMSLWADPRGECLRTALPKFTDALQDRMSTPGDPSNTFHVLMRDSLVGLLTLSSLVKRGSIDEDYSVYISRVGNLSSPFPEADSIKESDIEDARHATRIDFRNYTIDRLIPNRRNYDFANPTYQDVFRQICMRILDLGYSSARFSDIDDTIGRDAWRQRQRSIGKTDRYGKKYSWIAYFEMYGLRLHQKLLPEYAGPRPSDVDIDPSFPTSPKTWMPSLPDPFGGAPTEPVLWLDDGPAPDYGHILDLKCVDDCTGPWILLNGYVQQSHAGDDRRVFTYLLCLLVAANQQSELIAAFRSMDKPSNAIPELHSDHYTYAAEIPWSRWFGAGLRDSNGRELPDRRTVCRVYDGSHTTRGIPVEIPVSMFAWESYHSDLNQVSNVYVPTPALCKQLGLRNHHGEWDLYDQNSELATICRHFKQEQDTHASHVTFIRADLMDKYMRKSGQVPVWLVWGERGFHLHNADNFMDDMWKRSPRYWQSYELTDEMGITMASERRE